MSICVIGDQHDIDRAKHHGTDAMSTEVRIPPANHPRDHD